jgi:RIO kinase 1
MEVNHFLLVQEWLGYRQVGMSNSVTTSVRDNMRRQAEGTTQTKEKADRATVEQALDPRTRMVLFKMLNRGVFQEINGCISTGKEVRFIGFFCFLYLFYCVEGAG